jgi:hypothetical protein
MSPDSLSRPKSAFSFRPIFAVLKARRSIRKPPFVQVGSGTRVAEFERPSLTVAPDPKLKLSIFRRSSVRFAHRKHRK